MNIRRLKAQSAMEYLMTYGWAILIIAVVLGALFSLGIFSGGAAIGTLCVPIPGYSCTGPALATTGNLSFTFGQNTGASEYNIGMGCSEAASPAGLPLPNPVAPTGDCGAGGCSMVFLSELGTSLTATPTNMVSPNVVNSLPVGQILTALPNGQLFSVSGLKCWGPAGASLTGSAIGSPFTGSLWINYTLNPAAPSSANPFYSVKFATLNTKVV